MTETRIDIDILIAADGWRDPALKAEKTVRAAAAAAMAGRTGFDGGVEISVLLADNDAVADLNAQWRGKSGPTNVLSFPGDLDGPGPAVLGDVVLALETVQAEAAEAGIPAADHIAHLVVHGVLHLLGYDHETDGEAAGMERAEVDVLGVLGVPDPYAAAQRKIDGAVS